MNPLECVNCEIQKEGGELFCGPDENLRCKEHHDIIMNHPSQTGGLRKAWYCKTGLFTNR